MDAIHLQAKLSHCGLRSILDSQIGIVEFVFVSVCVRHFPFRINNCGDIVEWWRSAAQAHYFLLT